MKAEDLLLLGGVGLVAYLIYQSASTAADVVPNLFSSAASAASSALQAVTGAVQGGVQAVQTGAQTVAAAPSMWNCGDAYMTAQMPFGVGAFSVPDSYLIPCSGGVTAGSLRAGGISNSDLINYIAGLECSCAAAKMPGSGVTVQGNVIVSNPLGISGYRLPAGVVRLR